MRYAPYGGVAKGLGVAERDDLLAHGLSIGMVFESTAGRALSGAAAGVTDAKIVQAGFAALGFPASMPCYFGVDFDASLAQQPLIDAYLDGAASILGAEQV